MISKRQIFCRIYFSCMLIIFLSLATCATSANRVWPAMQFVKESGNYRLTDCGSIYDASSGLEWFVGPDQITSWNGALGWVQRLDACGGGWSMPSPKDLQTLTNPAVTSADDRMLIVTPDFMRLAGGREQQFWTTDRELRPVTSQLPAPYLLKKPTTAEPVGPQVMKRAVAVRKR